MVSGRDACDHGKKKPTETINLAFCFKSLISIQNDITDGRIKAKFFWRRARRLPHQFKPETGHLDAFFSGQKE
jgi:hypothetical protein